MVTPEVAADLMSESLILTMVIVAVLVLPGLVVGLVISLLQAATQINEQTLSFLPRLLVTLLAIAIAGPWIGSKLMDFCVSIFTRAATLVG